MSKTFFFGHTKIVHAKRNTKYFFIFLQENNKQHLPAVQNLLEKFWQSYTTNPSSLHNYLTVSTSARYTAFVPASPLH